MANFIVHVELHGATSEDYSVLDTAMENAGYTRTIVNAGRYTFQLPPAEYVTSSFVDCDSARDKAYNVAVMVCQNSGLITRNPSIVAAEFTSLTWMNLEEVC